MRIIDWSSDVCSSDRRQATDYFAGLTDAELPRYVLVSDFARFRLYDLDGEAGPVEFALADLPRQIGRFRFISGYQTRTFKERSEEHTSELQSLIRKSYAGFYLKNN